MRVQNENQDLSLPLVSLSLFFPSKAAAAAALIKWVGKERKRNWFMNFLRVVWPTEEAVRMSNLGWESGA